MATAGCDVSDVLPGPRAPPAAVYRLEDIVGAVADVDAVIAQIEAGFVAASEARVTVAPVVHMGFKPAGDCCIKAGFIGGDDYFVVKIAPGCFSGNSSLQPPLPGNTGVMMVFSQHTGMLRGVLLDEGYLTELRTAAAGALAAKRLAPRNVTCIGILGSGVQARYQLELLRGVTTCRRVMVWGRTEKNLLKFKADVESRWGFSCTVVQGEEGLVHLGEACNLIVCATTSRTPLLHARHLQPGTHVTAMGVDAVGKQELDASVFTVASLVVADNKDQCCKFGDIANGLQAGTVSEADIVELGEVCSSPSMQRLAPGDTRITVFDSTGVAHQDVAIATMVFNALQSRRMERASTSGCTRNVNGSTGAAANVRPCPKSVEGDNHGSSQRTRGGMRSRL